MSDGIYRIKKRLDPVEPLTDRRLSWDEKGMMAYLLSKPNDWEIRHADLIGQSPDGRDKVARIKRGLIAKGYLAMTRERSAEGQFTWVTIVYESPALNHTYVEKIGAEINAQEIGRESTITGFSVDGLTVNGKPGYLLDTSIKTSNKNADKKSSAKLSAKDRNEIRSALQQHFEMLTRISAPTNNRSAGALWWKPLKEIADLCEWDADKARWVIEESVKRLKGVTIKSPKSLFNTALSILREMDDAEPEEYTMLGGKEHDGREWTPL